MLSALTLLLALARAKPHTLDEALTAFRFVVL